MSLKSVSELLENLPAIFKKLVALPRRLGNLLGSLLEKLGGWVRRPGRATVVIAIVLAMGLAYWFWDEVRLWFAAKTTNRPMVASCGKFRRCVVFQWSPSPTPQISTNSIPVSDWGYTVYRVDNQQLHHVSYGVAIETIRGNQPLFVVDRSVEPGHLYWYHVIRWLTDPEDRNKVDKWLWDELTPGWAGTLTTPPSNALNN